MKRLFHWIKKIFSRKKGEKVRTSPSSAEPPLPVVIGSDDPIQALMVSLTFRVGGQVWAERGVDGILVEIANASDEADNGSYVIPFKTTTPNEVMAMDQLSFRKRFKVDDREN